MRLLLEIPLMWLAGIWQSLLQDFNVLEILIIAALAIAWRQGWWKAWRPRRMPLPQIRRPWAAAVILALGFVALRIALVPVMPVPTPLITDEFSHLLLADTLLQGR